MDAQAVVHSTYEGNRANNETGVGDFDDVHNEYGALLALVLEYLERQERRAQGWDL